MIKKHGGEVLESVTDEDHRRSGGACKPSSWGLQIVALIFMCSMGFGTYVDFEIPAALIGQFYYTMQIGDVDYSLLYSLPSWSNLFMSVFGGYLTDRVFGPRVASVIFVSFCIIGQYILAAGAFVDSFLLMEISRLVYGMGDMPIAIIQSIYTAAWFKGKALNLASGLQLSISRVGSTATFQVAPAVYNLTKEWKGDDNNQVLGWTLVFMSVSTILSLIGVLVSCCLDRQREAFNECHLEEQENDVQLNMSEKGWLKRLLNSWVFPLTYWLLCLVCVTFYATIFPFVEFGKNLYMDKFDMTERESNFINGLIYLISAGATPLFGFIIDRVGFNVFFLMVGCLITFLGHGFILVALFNATSIIFSPYMGTVLIGLGYSVTVSTLWPMVALIVPMTRQGTAYGLLHGIQSLGLAITPVIYGWLKQVGGWKALQYFNLGCLMTSAMGSLGFWLSSSIKYDGYFNMKQSIRASYEKSKAYTDMMQRSFGTVPAQPIATNDVVNA